MGRETQFASDAQLEELYATLKVCGDTIKNVATDIKRKVSEINSGEKRDAILKGGNGDRICALLEEIGKNQDFLSEQAAKFYAFGNKKLGELDELNKDRHGLASKADEVAAIRR